MLLSIQLTLDNVDIKNSASLNDFALPQYAPILTSSQELIFGALSELYLFGDEGSGKTHLLSAIHQTYLTTYSSQGRLAMFLSIDELLSNDPQMLTGLEQFSLLLIDNLHLLAGHRDWQEALFHLINRMRSRGHKLIYTANTPVRELDFSLLDLITRLSQAPALPMPYGDELHERLAIIELLSQKRGWRLADQVVELLAEVGPHHIGDMLKVLEKIAPQFPKQKYKKFSKRTLDNIKNAISYQSFMIEISDIDTHHYDEPMDNNLSLPL